MSFIIPDYLHERVAEVINNAMVSIDEIRDALLVKVRGASISDARERRQYALLQAAATIHGDDHLSVLGEQLIPQCVDRAEALLAEVEKRENAEAQS